MTPQSSGLKINLSRKTIAACFMLFSCLVCSSTLKMETYSSKAFVDFQQTTRRCVPEDGNLEVGQESVRRFGPSSSRKITRL
jgi:hypothetical protein